MAIDRRIDQLFFLKMNHWCVKQILHLVKFKNLYICFCYISLHLPTIWYQRALGPIHYITLKLLQWHWEIGPSVKHVLEVLEWFYMLTEKILFQNRGLPFLILFTPPPRFVKWAQFFRVFFPDPFPNRYASLGGYCMYLCVYMEIGNTYYHRIHVWLLNPYIW